VGKSTVSVNLALALQHVGHGVERRVVCAADDELRKRRRGELCERAARCGAILFRGFPVRTAEDFDGFVGAFGLLLTMAA